MEFMRRLTILNLIIFLVLINQGCSKKQEPIAVETSLEVEQQISKFQLSGYAEGGKKKWQIEGDSADVLAESVNLNNIVAKAYGAQMPATLTADTGVVDKKTNNIHLQNNVVINAQSGATLKTDNLDWKAHAQEVHTQADVVVQKDNMETTGRGLDGQTQLQKIKILENVTVKIQPATVISCSGPLEVDYGNSTAVFNKDVKIADERGKLVADKMTVYFDQKNQKLKKVVAKGHVVISRGENSSTSEEATYLADENKVVLTGSPKIEIYTDKDVTKELGK